MDFKLDGDSPLYKQIVDQILKKIKSGELPPGSRLPTERELARELSVARGTVKKAYAELADNNIIEVIQGSGSYVYSEKQTFSGERRRMAINLIEELLTKLFYWDFSLKETSTLIRMCLARRESAGWMVHVAAIDCNPESLSIIKRQLSYLPNIDLTLFSVDSIILTDNAPHLFTSFDLILTTETHYEQVMGSLTGTGLRVLPVSVGLRNQTIVDLSTLPEKCAIGIFCVSNKFANLISQQIAAFRSVSRPIPVCFEGDKASAERFLRKLDCVVVNPGSALLQPDLFGDVGQRFADRGGRIIPFDYLIDRGSLIHIEEEIDRAMKEKLPFPADTD